MVSNDKDLEFAVHQVQRQHSTDRLQLRPNPTLTILLTLSPVNTC